MFGKHELVRVPVATATAPCAWGASIKQGAKSTTKYFLRAEKRPQCWIQGIRQRKEQLLCEMNFYSKAGSTGPYDLICFFLFSSSGKVGGFGLLLLQALEQSVPERLEKECDLKMKIKRTRKEWETATPSGKKK